MDLYIIFTYILKDDMMVLQARNVKPEQFVTYVDDAMGFTV